MLGKDAILHFFEQKGIKNLFHLPGIHTLPLNERALKNCEIRFIHGRHESSTAFMADGYARATGEAGVLVVTPGPGLGNIVSGCMEAFSHDVPLVVLHIDTGRKEIGKGILHELKEPESIFTHFTKGAFSVSRGEELIPSLDRAFRLALEGRNGPVVISVPYTLFEKEVPFALPDCEGRRNERGMGEIAGALEHKKRPVIIGGRGLMEERLRPLLDALCREGGIPFLTTTSGKGVLPETSPWTFGNVMQKGVTRSILESADAVIAIGTRLRDVDAKRRGVKIPHLIHIDVDSAWMGKNYPPACAVPGDLAPPLEELRKVAGTGRFLWDLPALKKAQEEERLALKKVSPGFRLMSTIRDALPPETVTLWDLSLLGYWAEYFYPVEHQRSFIMPRGISPIFYAFPAGIGAKVGRPDRPCLAVCGDGSFLPPAAELATLVQYRVPLVTIVYNNRGYGILEDYMVSSYGVRGSMDLVNPDFVKLSKSFGVKAIRVRSEEGLKRQLLREVTWEEPYVIELDYPSFPPPWK